MGEAVFVHLFSRLQNGASNLLRAYPTLISCYLCELRQPFHVLLTGSKLDPLTRYQNQTLDKNLLIGCSIFCAFMPLFLCDPYITNKPILLYQSLLHSDEPKFVPEKNYYLSKQYTGMSGFSNHCQLVICFNKTLIFVCTQRNLHQPSSKGHGVGIVGVEPTT